MKNLNVRIDDELHARLTETARQDKRSLNSEILILLSEALSERSYNQAPVEEGQS
jgi:predicted HicB family RNase H-like nuclease